VIVGSSARSWAKQGCFAVTFSTRYFLSLGNVALSLVLGVLAMGFFFYYYPDQFLQLQRGAAGVREWLANHAWSARSESIIRFLLEDKQILLMGFTLVTRVITGLIIGSIHSLFNRGR
jgi:hypothetical protein